MPSRRSRVSPGISDTSAARVAVSRLNSVDLPTLGRPTMATTGGGEDKDTWRGSGQNNAAGRRRGFGRMARHCGACDGVPSTISQLRAISFAVSVSTNMRPCATTGEM